MNDEVHEGQHMDCPPCFAIKVRSVQFQGIDAGQRRFTDRERDGDMAAYKRMRNHGIQPQHVFGSREIEAQANTSWEAEHNLILSDPIRKEMVGRLEDAKAAS